MDIPGHPDMEIISRQTLGPGVPDELLKFGVVNVIGLESIKERTGERWEKLSDSVYSRLEAILRRKLRGVDFFTRLNPTSYLVTMPEVEKEYAQVCCLSVAVELHRGLFGSCNLGEIEILAGTPGEDDTIALEKIAADDIAALARKHGLNEPREVAVEQPGQSHGAMPQASAATKGFVFWPIWDPRKEAVIGYRCMRAAGNAGLARPGNQPRAKADAQLIVSALKHTATTLTGHVERGERFFISVPMTYEALSCPLTRTEIASACRDLSNRLRAYLLFEIVDVPRGVPAGRLADLAATIRPLCKSVIVHAPFRDRSFAAHAANVAQAIALDVPNLASPSEVRAEIDRVRQDAQYLGCGSMMANVAEPEFFRFAMSRGVSLISGPLLGAMTTPRPMHRLRADEILSRAEARSPRSAARLSVASGKAA